MIPWTLVALAAALSAALLLAQPSCASPLEDDNEDRPHINYPALFKAFFDVGEAIFGTWAPERFKEQLNMQRDSYYR
ncbi:uncharacterized protein LOC117592648 [Drosophila guanche]|uniref:Uncharacterized protein n=1 Tax=Drosophila guanche TaxID=7266 RepID=A0A3B0JR03_DROGU|nr:uncharacterized protein LOC117592648 [Drosophila guanche]SPP73578.1 Hypothetical predicted protein [Drosophila guanche]